MVNGKATNGILAAGDIAFRKIARRIRLTTSSTNTADISVDFIFDSTLNSLNMGAITPIEDELKTMPRSNDAKMPIPQKNPTAKPVAKGIQIFNKEKRKTSLLAFFNPEKFVSNPAVNIRKTSPRVARKSVTSPGLTHPKP